MEIVIVGIGVLAILVLNLLCGVLPFLIVAMCQTRQSGRLLAFIAIFLLVLPATVAVDWGIVSLIRTVSAPGFG